MAMASDDGARLIRATRADVRRVAAMLARAFQDDPLMRYAIPDDERRRRLLPRLIALNVRYGRRYGVPNHEHVATRREDSHSM